MAYRGKTVDKKNSLHHSDIHMHFQDYGLCMFTLTFEWKKHHCATIVDGVCVWVFRGNARVKVGWMCSEYQSGDRGDKVQRNPPLSSLPAYGALCGSAVFVYVLHWSKELAGLNS